MKLISNAENFSDKFWSTNEKNIIYYGDEYINPFNSFKNEKFFEFVPPIIYTEKRQYIIVKDIKGKRYLFNNKNEKTRYFFSFFSTFSFEFKIKKQLRILKKNNKHKNRSFNYTLFQIVILKLYSYDNTSCSKKFNF